MTYKKGIKVQVGRHFESTDFDCPCGLQDCTVTLIDPSLVWLLDQMRDELDCPLYVTKGGGFRCAKHQQDLRDRGLETALGRSQHELGNAADVRTMKHSGIALEKAARIAGFRAVGVSTSWVHVDIRNDKARRWSYVKR